eukprot:CAMPEP_0177673868 /NCGR_PEP_ID=MMETSP0447-20121125/26213_1 /TAXON_ID=0 /ORGANISM="Stygamoeba regulata, Strain BSH-02190019" /LENGTH=37 /DNA_ID= /DNA_START= /DNA_END= /DNA_ORIENTATION=
MPSSPTVSTPVGCVDVVVIVEFDGELDEEDEESIALP